MAATLSAKTSAIDPFAAAPEPIPSGPFSIFRRLSKWRTDLGLPYPGNTEDLTKEVKRTQLTNLLYDGARADLAKAMSMNPLFQVTHSFSLGSQTMPPTYSFGAMYGTEKSFLHGTVDHDGNVTSRWHQSWSPKSTTKMQAQSASSGVPGHSVAIFEHDYQGQDYSLNAKATNPWPTDMSGIFVFSYLQSLTRNLALGGECLVTRSPMMPSGNATSLIGKWTSTDKSWIASASLMPDNTINATYWHKLSEKVDVAAELMMSAGSVRREGLATLAAKYDLRMSTFRAQVDSAGKVGAVLEQRFTPVFAFTLNGEIDHFKNTAKVGFGVQIESSTLSDEELSAQMGVPPPGALVI